MLLEIEQTMIRTQDRAGTNPVNAFPAPSVSIRPSVSEHTETLGDREQPSDGIRVLGVISSTERSRHYQHVVSSRLEVLQSWEGVVISIDYAHSTFTARLYDLTASDLPVSEVELDIRDVSSNDHDLLRPGSIFRWMIGYRKHSYGQQDRVSSIVFRRLPNWSKADLAAASAEGERIVSELVIE